MNTAVKKRRPNSPPMQPGERWGRLVAVARGPEYVSPGSGQKKSRWWFDCDCGESVLLDPGSARYNTREGWGCCPNCIWCIRAAGEPRASLRQETGIQTDPIVQKKQLILDAVDQAGGVERSKTQIYRSVGGRKTEVFRLVEELVCEQKLTPSRGGFIKR